MSLASFKCAHSFVRRRQYIYIERERERFTRRRSAPTKSAVEEDYVGFLLSFPKVLFSSSFLISTRSIVQRCVLCVENAKAGDTNVYKKADSFLYSSSSHKFQREEDPHSPHFFPFFFPIFFPRKERKTKKKKDKKENPKRKRKERDKNPKSESSVLFLCVYF